jgi:hypothetical protein
MEKESNKNGKKEHSFTMEIKEGGAGNPIIIVKFKQSSNVIFLACMVARAISIFYVDLKMNVYSAMFLITLIRLEKYRFNYGRKWHKERMEESKISLPVDDKRKPDWDFIEEYIKSLKYSAFL